LHGTLGFHLDKWLFGLRDGELLHLIDNIVVSEVVHAQLDSGGRLVSCPVVGCKEVFIARDSNRVSRVVGVGDLELAHGDMREPSVFSHYAEELSGR